MVTIHVGQKRKQFHIHRNLLCAKSAFFQAAFSAAPPAAAASDPDAKVRLRTAIYLEEKDPDAFGLFVDWLYKDKFVGPVCEAPPPPPQQKCVFAAAPTAGENSNGRLQGTTTAILNTVDQNYRPKLTLLLNLHGMALQWGFPALQNLCIDRMRAYNAQSRAIFHPEHLAQIYQETGPSSLRTAGEGQGGGVEVVGGGGYDSAPLRQYAVRQFVARIMDKKVSKLGRARMVRNRVGVAGGQFMEEVFQALAVQHRRKAVEDVEGMEGCIFHAHGAEGKCAEDG